MLTLQGGGALGDYAPQRPDERGRPAFGDGDWQAELAAGRGNLRPGKPAPDHQHPARPGGQALTEALGVLPPAQGINAF